MWLGDFRSLCQMKFGQDTETHVVTHVASPVTCLFIWVFLLLFSAQVQSAGPNSGLELLRLFLEVLLLLLVYPECFEW